MNPAVVLAVLVGGVLVMLLARAIDMKLALRRAGTGGTREYDMLRVAEYSEHLGPSVALLPAQAWNDLNLDQVFQRLDRTISWPGQHLLYARLRLEDHAPESLGR